MQPLEIFVDDETKLTLHGLQQHYVKLDESGKNRKLNDLLDNLEFNQVRCHEVKDGCNVEHFVGRYLRQVCCSCHRAGQTPCFLQLPEYRYSFGPAARRTVSHRPLIIHHPELNPFSISVSVDTLRSRRSKSVYWLPLTSLGAVSMSSVSIS